MRKRVVVAVGLVVILGVGAPTVAAVFYAHTGYRDAEELFAHQLFPQARERLARYLWLYPHHAQARLLMAEALINDERLLADVAAVQALQHLGHIPDSSSDAAEARFREGGVYFLLLQKPGRGEQLLRKSIQLGADVRAYQLLWTLLNFTGRSEESEAIFWRVYELSSDNERPLRLRELYLNQFFPNVANAYLDRRMGILAPNETPSRLTESRRYLRFRKREPEAPANHAAVAQWCQQEGDPEFAKRVLDAAKSLPGAQSDLFFLSVSIATHLDLGQFDEAEASFERWPDHDRGHAYWKWRALILDEVRGQQEAALHAYDRALALWPGPIDLKLHHRMAACLTRLGKTEEAEAVKDRIAQRRAILTDETLDRLRAILASLDNPEQLNEVAQFYRQLGCDREADCWESHIRSLQAGAVEAP